MTVGGPAPRRNAGDAPRATRRAVLRGGTGAAVAAVAAGLTAAVPMLGSCTRDSAPDELEAPLAAARADAALAAAVVVAHPDLADRMNPVTADRRAHADALAAEVKRARPDRADAVEEPAAGGPPAPPTPAAPPATAAALAAVRDALGRSRDAGRTVALGAAPYRCGLLASVAASCAGHVAVLT